jgi:hypothetical protein
VVVHEELMAMTCVLCEKMIAGGLPWPGRSWREAGQGGQGRTGTGQVPGPGVGLNGGLPQVRHCPGPGPLDPWTQNVGISDYGNIGLSDKFVIPKRESIHQYIT